MQLDLTIDLISRSVKRTGIFCLSRFLPEALRRVQGIEAKDGNRVLLMRATQIWAGIKLHLYILLLAGMCSAQSYSLRLGATQYAHVNPVTNWTLGNYRIEIGITKRSGTFDASDAGQQIFYDAGPGYWRCQTDTGGAGVRIWCRDVHNNSDIVSVDITGMSDVRFRFQRSVSGLIGSSTLSAGLWDGQGNLVREYIDIPNLPETSYSWGQPMVVGQTGLTFDIRFIRFGTTLLPLGSKAPVEIPSTPSEFVEYDFENSLAEANNSAMNLLINTGGVDGTTCNTTCSYQASPTYTPVAGFGGQQFGIAANQAYTLHGDTYSFSSKNLSGNPTSYVWTLVSKQFSGMDGTLATPSAATTTMALNDYLGTYVVSLQVSDAAGSSPTVSAKIGAVPENADHTVKYYHTDLTQSGQEASFKLGTGPLLRFGASTHSAYEHNWLAYANDPGFGTLYWAPVAEIGNIGCTGHVNSISGGWTFTQDTNSPVPCNFTAYVSTSDPLYNIFWVHMPLPDGSQNGRFADSIRSVTATQITGTFQGLNATMIAQFPCTNPGPCYQWGGIPNTGNAGGFSSWNGSNANWNYYDNALGFYRLWLTTGIDDFLTRARAVEDEHWQHTLANGLLAWCSGEPRCDAIVSASLRALDGKTWMWPWIDYRLTSPDWNNGAGRSAAMNATMAYPTNYGFGELRDAAYDLRGVSMIAGSIQNADGTPNTTRRAQYCTGVWQGVENIFKPTISSGGIWILNSLQGGYTTTFGGPGSSPFMNGLVSSGALEMARDVMTTACTNISDRAMVASDALALIKTSADTLYGALDANKGAFGYINYDVLRVDGTNGVAANGLPGFISITNGSQSVVGTGLKFNPSLSTGSPNDAFFGGTYSATVYHKYTVVIDSTGTPNTFKWQVDSGTFTTGVAITGAAQTLSNGVTITFVATTGHALSSSYIGESTNFTVHFLNDGSTWWGTDAGAGVGSVLNHVTSVTDDTHMTIETPWSHATLVNGGVGVGSNAHALTGPGTITLTNGSPIVVGTGTAFRTNFLSDCTTFISPYGDRRLYLILTVTDDTHMTLASDGNCTAQANWQDPTLTNITYQKTITAVSGALCAPSTALTCAGFASGGGWQFGGGPIGDLGLNHEQINGMGYYFKQSGTAAYKTNGDAWFTATYGGMGPGYPPYWAQLGKPFGQVYGAGNSANFLANIAVTGPCSNLSFSPSSASAAATGATGTFDASVTDSSCDRSVTSSAPTWLTCSANCSGTGSVTGIGWSAAANAGTARSATLTSTTGVAFSVTQSGSVTCTYSLAPSSHNYPAAGAVQPVTITASDSSCAWTASYPDAWLTGPMTGTGTQSFSVTAAANLGTARSSTATIAGQSYAATQDAGVGGTGTPSTTISGGHAISGGVRIQ